MVDLKVQGRDPFTQLHATLGNVFGIFLFIIPVVQCWLNRKALCLFQKKRKIQHSFRSGVLSTADLRHEVDSKLGPFLMRLYYSFLLSRSVPQSGDRSLTTPASPC